MDVFSRDHGTHHGFTGHWAVRTTPYISTPAHHPPEGEGSPDVPQLGCEELGAAVLRLLASDALTDIFC